MEVHWGRIRIESGGLGLGTRSTFTIPVAKEGGVAGSLRNLPLEEWKDTRILVVNDDPKTLGYVRDALASEGYVPLVTGDPRKVTNLIRTTNPGLVLLDLMLPGIDGIVLMERLPEMSALPVILISGYGRDETIARTLDMGAGRLHRQALLADGAVGESPGGLAQAVRTSRTIPAGGPDYRLRATPGDGGRARSQAHGHRIRSAASALDQCRTGHDS